jgi:hypothetical protein
VSSTSIEERLAAGDDHVFLPVGDCQVTLAVEPAAVSGVKPAVIERFRARLGVVPVAGEDDVAPGDDLAGAIGPQTHSHCGRTAAAEFGRALCWRQGVVGRAGTVESGPFPIL